MLGEAIRDSAQEAENEATKRTNIPMPPANDLLKKMGFPMDQPQYGYPYAQYYQVQIDDENDDGDGDDDDDDDSIDDYGIIWNLAPVME